MSACVLFLGFFWFGVLVLEMDLVVAFVELHSSRLRRCTGVRCLKEYGVEHFPVGKSGVIKEG